MKTLDALLGERDDKAILAEFRRLQDENEFLKSKEEFLTKENARLTKESADNNDQAIDFAWRLGDCAKECRELHMELDRRPPVDPKPSIRRRLEYLFTGR